MAVRKVGNHASVASTTSAGNGGATNAQRQEMRSPMESKNQQDIRPRLGSTVYKTTGERQMRRAVTAPLSLPTVLIPY